MKKNILFILSVFLLILTSCSELKEKAELKKQEFIFIPVNYDFDNLRLRLNSLINDSVANIEWRRDYMNSENSEYDTNGIEKYMNISQPVFSFNRETTVPFLSITTNGKRIIRFSSTIIFRLENQQSIETLLDSLSMIDILEDEKVRQSIINKHKYLARSEHFEERLDLHISPNEYGYDRITYEIKIIP